MRYHGIDPSSTHTGYAALEPVPGRQVPDLVTFGVVRLGDDRWEEKLARELLEPFSEAGPADKWAIEAPPKVRARSTGHGKQVWSGYLVGYISGVVAGFIHLHHPDALIARPGSKDWRNRMLALSSAWGTPITTHQRPPLPKGGKPARLERLEEGRFRLHWKCGHHWDASSLIVLQRFQPYRCPTCQQNRSAGPEARRDAWKAAAVQFVATHWPEQLEELCGPIRARARDKDKPAHRLAGVADACEAVGIACYHLPCFQRSQSRG